MQDRNPVGQMYQAFNDLGISRDYTEAPALKSKYVGLNFPTTPAAGSRFYFRQDRQLRRLKGIKVFSADQVAQAYIQGTSYTTVLADQYKDAMLVLVDSSRRILTKLPLFALLTTVNNGKPTFLDMEVLWNNCYVQFTDATGSVATTEAFVFQVWFE